MLPLARDKQPHIHHAQPYRHRRARRHFLVAWMRSPLKVGAVMPSSRRLARAMAEQVDMKRPGTIIELGAGTGVVTHALLQAGIPPERLLIIEREPKLHGVLAAQFPDLTIVCADAMSLTEVLSEQKIDKVCAVVSSLPLLSMPKSVAHAIMQQMLKAFGKEGVMVQFTYGPRSPIHRGLLRRQHISGRRVKTVLANMPPAHIWVYKRLAS